MLEKRNPSAFWVFADLLVSSRAHLAWSNLAKIDSKGSAPPSAREWKQIEEVCVNALLEEMENLNPRRTVFVTGNYHRTLISELLQHQLGFARHGAGLALDGTELFSDARGRLAVVTRHPQGWGTCDRDPVAQYIRNWT